MIERMIEILAPSGNEECALTAIQSGANAIYLGYTAFSARDGADNFGEEGLIKILQRAHLSGVKVYLAMNTVVKTAELDGFLETLLKVWSLGVDAIILQDMFLGEYIHGLYPEIVLHLSTQAGICTEEGARLAKECGFSRVILARETPLSEIKKITKILETEVFVQGALCTCYSGQCYFSSFVGGNSGNRGRCKQPCRKKYTYDRNGYTEKAYALSLSDLSVGEEIYKLIEAGVVSFKIEGRMRRKEYVAAAIRYYRTILNGENSIQALSDLKRTYNRGNYTKGLAFGQDKRFLSRAVQGHIGEKVGTVKVEKGRFLVESSFHTKQGDSFKILRDGAEVAGATFGGTYSRGFILFSKTRLMNGDGVFVTTDSSLNDRLLNFAETTKTIVPLSVRFAVGEKGIATAGGIVCETQELLGPAASKPLTEEDVKNCFLKTDGAPIEIRFDEIQIVGDIFIPKSQLNAFRRAFYEKLLSWYSGANRAVLQPIWQIPAWKGLNGKTAVIADDFRGVACDIAIWKPSDYASSQPNFTDGQAEKYLYLPPFHTSADIARIKDLLEEYSFDGIYAENYDGIEIAKALNCKLFAGTGFNITNPISLSQIYDSVSYYAISKELSEAESKPLQTDKAFSLSCGDVKIMDICYCPFEKTCNRCDRRLRYTLTDENGREFPVRRYTDAQGVCRFEIYNCASLVGKGVHGMGKLIDCTIQSSPKALLAARDNEGAQKTIFRAYTSGHYKNGVL